MAVCFLCDAQLLFKEKTRVCSNITPHSHVPYPEKIAELMGEEFVVVVTPDDFICIKCTSLLTRMDKLENEVKFIKNGMLDSIQRKYGLLPANQPIKALDIVNGQLKTDGLEVDQRKVPSGLTIRDNSVSTPLEMLKTQQQENAPKMNIYKCALCSFHSKLSENVRLHVRNTHMIKKRNNEKLNHSVPITLTPTAQQPKREVFKCQVCSACFDSPLNRSIHIKKDHIQQAKPTANEEKKPEENQLEAIVIIEPKILTLEDDSQDESNMDIVDSQQEKGSVDTDMLLNDNVPANGTEVLKQEEESYNIEEVFEQAEGMQVDKGIPDSVQKGVEEDKAIRGEENVTEDLDIESMLAAIHNGVPPAVGDAVQ